MRSEFANEMAGVKMKSLLIYRGHVNPLPRATPISAMDSQKVFVSISFPHR